MKELELILQAVTQLGDAGKEAFIWWLVLDKLFGTLCILTIVGAFVFLGLKVIGIYTSEKQLEQLRSEMGISNYGSVVPSEFREMLNWIRARK